MPHTPKSLQSYLNTPRQLSIRGEALHSSLPTSTLDQLQPWWYLTSWTVCSNSNPATVGKQGTVTGRDHSTWNLTGPKPQEKVNHVGLKTSSASGTKGTGLDTDRPSAILSGICFSLRQGCFTLVDCMKSGDFKPAFFFLTSPTPFWGTVSCFKCLQCCCLQSEILYIPLPAGESSQQRLKETDPWSAYFSLGNNRRLRHRWISSETDIM